MVEITLLGRVSVAVSGVPLTGEAAQRRRLALLAMLCEHPIRPVSRDRLMLHLWPDNDTESAKRLLSASLYVLRKALGADVILTPGDQLELNPALVQVDAVSFEEAARGDDPEAALALYGGTFLEGLYVPGSPEYDQWLESRRQELARLYANVLERCAAARTAAGDLDGAVEAWRRLLQQDVYSARATLGLMHALAATGNRAAALQAARVHATLLKSEFDATPEPEVQSFAEQLRHEQVETGRSTDPPGAPSSHAADASPSGPGRRDVPAANAAPPATPPAAAADAGGGAAADVGVGAARSAPRDPGPDRAAAVAPAPAAADRAVRQADGRSARRGLAARGSAVAVLVPVLLLVVYLWPDPAAPVDPAEAPSVAVIWRAADGTDRSSDYISHGIADGVLQALDRSPGLRVISGFLTLVAPHSGTEEDPREIGRRLAADRLVLVQSRPRDGDVRVTVDLLRQRDGVSEWNRQYDVHRGDFTSQDNIARDIAAALKVSVGPPAELARGVTAGTTSVQAHDLWMQGRFEWSKRQNESLLRAVDLFHAALRADPDYAWAHVGLADAYNMLGSYDYGVLHPDSAFRLARQAATRALQIAPEFAPAHAALANVRMNYDWDWAGAEESFRRAIALNPGYTPAREWLAYLLAARGRVVEALEELHAALSHNPSSALILTDIAHLHYYNRDFAQAHTYLERALEADPAFDRAHVMRALLAAHTGAAAAVIPGLSQLAAHRGAEDPVLLGLLGYALGVEGQHGEARVQLARLQQIERTRHVPVEYRAIIHIALGEHDRALDLLEVALERRSSSMIYLKVDPLVDPLRELPRFRRICERVDRRR
jgi:DNA-binding SARP family transcriptional activator/tetratricopeptide (TPR) repeat protein/TolB-like protein